MTIVWQSGDCGWLAGASTAESETVGFIRSISEIRLAVHSLLAAAVTFCSCQEAHIRVRSDRTKSQSAGFVNSQYALSMYGVKHPVAQTCSV